MNLKLTEMKARSDAKLNKQIIRRAMSNYARFGANSSYTNVLSEQELDTRRKNWKKPLPKHKKGVLAKYSRIVSTSSLGAVTDLEK